MVTSYRILPIVMLLAAPMVADTKSLRCVIYGGAPLHVEHAKAALQRFGQVFVQFIIV